METINNLDSIFNFNYLYTIKKYFYKIFNSFITIKQTNNFYKKK